jgi:hypothetical protein
MTNDWKIKELTKQEKAADEKLRSRGIEPVTPQLNVDLALSIFPIVTPNCNSDVSMICVICLRAMLERIKHVRIPSRLTYLHIEPIIVDGKSVSFEGYTLEYKDFVKYSRDSTRVTVRKNIDHNVWIQSSFESRLAEFWKLIRHAIEAIGPRSISSDDKSRLLNVVEEESAKMISSNQPQPLG